MFLNIHPQNFSLPVIMALATVPKYWELKTNKKHGKNPVLITKDCVHKFFANPLLHGCHQYSNWRSSESSRLFT